MCQIVHIVYVITFCIIGAYAGIRDSFAVVALQFRFHDISPSYVDPAPKDLCEVRRSHH